VITFKQLDLFGSGPCRLEPGPTLSRDALAEAPGAIGAAAINQGLAPRTLSQRGTLVADTRADLRAQRVAIEARVGEAGELADDRGGVYAGCVLQRFEPGPVERLGPRFACDYTATYLQTTP